MVVKPFFVATIFTKLLIIYSLNAEEHNLGQFSRIIELFTQKFVTKL